MTNGTSATDCSGDSLTDQAMVVELDGTMRQIRWPYPPPPEGHLSLLYREVQCSTIELVRLWPGQAVEPDLPELSMWIDEEGKFEPKPVNRMATAIAQVIYPGSIMHNDVIVGRALLTGGADDDGETLPLSVDALLFLLSIRVVEDDDPTAEEGGA
jgi:hypothetical protein